MTMTAEQTSAPKTTREMLNEGLDALVDTENLLWELWERERINDLMLYREIALLDDGLAALANVEAIVDNLDEPANYKVELAAGICKMQRDDLLTA